MPITVSSRDSALTIALSGEIDHHAARELMAQLDQAIAERLPAHLVLDLSGVTFMDSSGIAVLLRARRQLGHTGGPCGWPISPPRREGCWTPPESGGSFP